MLLTVDFSNPTALFAADVVAGAFATPPEVVGPFERALVDGLPLVDVTAEDKL